MAVKSFWFALTLGFTGFLSASAMAQAPLGLFPLSCRAGVNCFILSYPDLDKMPGSAKDYACGPAASDGDGMLHIGLSSLEDLREGVNVTAFRDGKVLQVMDGIQDLVAAGPENLRRGTSVCGNGIIIDHGDGVQSAYCHLRRGSIRVNKGQQVYMGDVIAQAGQSGVAFWPQLGFSVQSSGVFIDPFSSMSQVEGCGWRQRPIFAIPPEFSDYQPAAIVSAGFSATPIEPDKMAMGTAPYALQISREEMKINFWAMVLGAHVGDEVEIRLRGPTGRTFEYRKIVIDTDKDRLPVNVSRTRSYAPWRQGTYTGEIILTREVEHRDVTTRRTVQTIVK